MKSLLLPLALLLAMAAAASAAVTQAQVAAARDYQAQQYNAASAMVVQLTEIASHYNILSYEFAGICQTCESYYRQKDKHGKARDALMVVLSVTTSDYTQRISDQADLQDNLSDIYTGQSTTQWLYDENGYPKAIMYDRGEKHSYAASVLGALIGQ